MRHVIAKVSDAVAVEQREDKLNNILMCPPKYFEVIDVKNAHMQGQIGSIDKEQALAQWNAMKQSVIDSGFEVHDLEPVEGLEDMVFAANPAFVGQNKAGEKIVILSNMTHASRKKEVPSYGSWFESQGYQVKSLSNSEWTFEGNGDGLWHPGKRLIWGGYGFRTKKDVYQEVSDVYDAPVCAVSLSQEHFYHLDTCFCPLNERSVLYYPGAFDQDGLDLIHHYFEDPIEVDQNEAQNHFACNSMALGNTVFVNQGNPKTVQAVKERNFEVVELNTSEFLKSGGSVFCMKLQVY